MDRTEREDQRDRAQRLKDQSALARKRARNLVRDSRERIDRLHHTWHMIAVGRVCTICYTAQAKGQFDDDVPCKAG